MDNHKPAIASRLMTAFRWHRGHDTNYKYKKLIHGADIRLLQLKPGSGDDKILISLKRAKFRREQHYEALSYAWGDNHKTHKVYVDGHFMMVTANLHSALHQLRSKNCSRVFWVDAICINQEDIKERDEQVRKMKTIFESADRVVVWLGEETPEDVVAFQMIQAFNDYADLHGYRVYVPPTEPFPADNETVIQRMDSFISNNYTASQLRILGNLLRRPWFRRLWVVQEIAFHEEVKLICGDQQTNWFSLWRLVDRLTTHARQLALGHQNQHCIKCITATGFARETILYGGLMGSGRDQKYLNKQAYGNFIFLYHSVRFHLAADPRDRIYALHGFLGPEDSENIVVDYSESYKDLYKRVARYCISVKRDLFCLQFVGGPFRNSRDLPSWVPDWNALNGDNQPLMCLFGEVAGTSVTKASISADNILTVGGFRLDIIEEVGTSHIQPLTTVQHSWELHQSAQREEAVLIECDNIAAKALPYPTGEDLSQIYWRILICNTNVENLLEPAPAYLAEAYQKVRECNRNLDYRGYASIPGALLYSKSLGTLPAYRHFCRTRGRYLGWVPIGTAPGDIICIFFGASVPHVLRPDGSDCYQLIGECYVHGFMSGEAMEEHPVEQEFNIR